MLPSARYCSVSGAHDASHGDGGERPCFRWLRTPAHVIAVHLGLSQPHVQRQRVRRPFVTVIAGDDAMRENAVQLAAQRREERGVAPARLQRRALRNRLASAEDHPIGGLQGIEGDFESHPKKAAADAEIAVGGGGQQMHEPRIALDHRHDVALERVLFGAIRVVEALEQRGVRRDHLLKRKHRQARISRRIRFVGS